MNELRNSCNVNIDIHQMLISVDNIMHQISVWCCEEVVVNLI